MGGHFEQCSVYVLEGALSQTNAPYLNLTSNASKSTCCTVVTRV